MPDYGDRRAKLSPEKVEKFLTDFDFAIFRILPDEGSKLGFHPQIKSAKQITHELNLALPPEAPRVQVSEVSARLRSLKMGGFVVDVVVNLSGRIGGWQRTPRARAKVA